MKIWDLIWKNFADLASLKDTQNLDIFWVQESELWFGNIEGWNWVCFSVMGPKPGTEEDEPELFLLPLAQSRTKPWQLCCFGEKFECMMGPTHYLHPSMLCCALPPGLVIIMCVIAKAVFQTNAGFAVSLRTLNFFGVYIWENPSWIPVGWHSTKISCRSLLWLPGCGCRCLVLWLLPGLRWEIKTTCTNQG